MILLVGVFLCLKLKHTTHDLRKLEAKYKDFFRNKIGNGTYEVVGCFQKRTAWSKHQCLIVFDSIDGTILGRCVRFVNVDSYISKTGKRIDFDEVKDSKEIQIIGNQLFVLE